MMFKRSVCGVMIAMAGSAPAQTCTPHWDVAVGTPGISGGYAAPILGYNDGSGEKLYVGGSFTAAGGSGAARYLARWDGAAWSAVGAGISPGFTNAFMTSILPYEVGGGTKLVVGGFFDAAGGVANTASLAMWNGTTWEAMGTGWTGTTRGSIWSMAEWNDRLYVGGGVVNQPAQIAGLPWAGMASWNGTAWQSHITTITGFSPNITGMRVFDDGSGEALFVVGRFTSLDGVAGTSLVAKWNGTNWASVGGGLTQVSTTSGLEAITVFNDGSGPALYVAGGAMTGPVPNCNVAKWNGTAWSAVGPQIGTGRLTSMTVFDDGTGATLYIGGTAMPQMNYIARWQGGAWVTVGGGIPVPASNFPSVFGLGVWQDRLYVAGNFTEIGSPATPTGGLAAWTSCSASCYANCDNSTAVPALNVQDFTCFLNAFASGDSYANCDNSTTAPVLNVQDFTCFLNAFAAGCP